MTLLKDGCMARLLTLFLLKRTFSSSWENTFPMPKLLVKKWNSSICSIRKGIDIEILKKV